VSPPPPNFSRSAISPVSRRKWKPFLEKNRGKELIFYCLSGARSGSAARLLAKERFSHRQRRQHLRLVRRRPAHVQTPKPSLIRVGINPKCLRTISLQTGSGGTATATSQSLVVAAGRRGGLFDPGAAAVGRSWSVARRFALTLWQSPPRPQPPAGVKYFLPLAVTGLALASISPSSRASDCRVSVIR